MFLKYQNYGMISSFYTLKITTLIQQICWMSNCSAARNINCEYFKNCFHRLMSANDACFTIAHMQKNPSCQRLCGIGKIGSTKHIHGFNNNLLLKYGKMQ